MMSLTAKTACSTSLVSQKCHPVATPFVSAHLGRAPSCLILESTQNRSVVAAAAKKAAKPAPKGFGPPKKSKEPVLEPAQPCLCGSGKIYGDCCCPFHLGTAVPATPEDLLRSRYTAYALKNAEYIADTTSTNSEEFTGTRVAYLQDVKTTMRKADWLGLEIASQETGPSFDEATITFSAWYINTAEKDQQRKKREETSIFKRDPKSKAWKYYGAVKLEEPGPPQQNSFLPNFKMPTIKI